MALPGVPRKRRILFVTQVMELLLKEGLDGITIEEHDRLTALTEQLLAQTEPVPEKMEEEPLEEPGEC